jgi:IS5 family transposase
MALVLAVIIVGFFSNGSGWEYGTKRHILTDTKNGIPLSVVITAANIHDDMKAVGGETLDNIVIKRRSRRQKYMHQ